MEDFSQTQPVTVLGTPMNPESKIPESQPYIRSEFNPPPLEAEGGLTNVPATDHGTLTPQSIPTGAKMYPSSDHGEEERTQITERESSVEKMFQDGGTEEDVKDSDKTSGPPNSSVMEINPSMEEEKNFLTTALFEQKVGEKEEVKREEKEQEEVQGPKTGTDVIHQVLQETPLERVEEGRKDSEKQEEVEKTDERQKTPEPDHMKDIEPFLGLTTTSQEREAINTLLEVSQQLPMPQQGAEKTDHLDSMFYGEEAKKQSLEPEVESYPEAAGENAPSEVTQSLEQTTALPENSEKEQPDSSMDVEEEGELTIADQEENAGETEAEDSHPKIENTIDVPPLNIMEASQKVKLEVSKALETVCRQVLMADKFIYITGNLNFCIDDRNLLKMAVDHNVENPSGRVFRNRRSRKNFAPVKTKPAGLYQERASNDGLDGELPSGQELLNNLTIDLKETAAVSRKKKQLYQCDKCSYVTKHLGFYKKHQRTKHSGLAESAAPTKQVPSTVKRKRGRPRKKPIPEPIESDIEPEPDPVSDLETEFDEYLPEHQSDVNEEAPDALPMKTRSASTTSVGKHKCEDCDYSTDHSGHFKEHINKHKGIRPFVCSLCPKSYTRQDDLQRHEETHNRKYECTMCATEFPERVLLKEHMKKVHNEIGRLQLFPCDICKKNLPTHADLEKHVEAKHNHICTNCGETFTHIAHLKQHKNEQHPNEALTCTICLKVCASRGALRKHMHRHRAGNKFPCDICGRTFTAQSTLYHHKRGVHSNLKPYECNQCEKRFNFHHSLKLHVLQHEGVRPYKCDICEKTYLTATHLKSHKQAVHEEKKKYLCVICNKRFPYENSLKMHMMLHTGDRPYLCNMCGRGFVNHSALKTHEASHVDSKQWECDICKKMYKTEALLRAHRRRHTNEGSRFMCDICGHTFMYKSNLEAHYTVHSNERKYNCKECGSTFKTAATLYSHRLVHSTETPYSCTVCSKAFKSKERKLAHERRHLGDKPFQCEICGRSFPDKGGLTKHCKTVHAKTKKFSCPVCKKTCSRADNLRVHMRIHRDPTLLKLDWKSLITEDGDDGGAGDLDLSYDQGQMPGGAMEADEHSAQQHGGANAGNVSHIMNNVSTAQSDVTSMVINTSGSTVHHHMPVQPHDQRQSNDLRQPTPSDMAQPNDLRQPTDLRQHHHRHPGHHHAPSHMHGVLVVPDPNLTSHHHHHHHHHSMNHAGGGTGVQQHHLTSVSSQVLQPPHSLPAPPPAHHQQPNHLQSQDYDTLGPMPQDSLRAIQVVMPPAAHSSTDDGSQSLQAPMSHHMRDYAEVANAMLFMQYQNLQSSHPQ